MRPSGREKATTKVSSGCGVHVTFEDGGMEVEEEEEEEEEEAQVASVRLFQSERPSVVRQQCHVQCSLWFRAEGKECLVCTQ